MKTLYLLILFLISPLLPCFSAYAVDETWGIIKSQSHGKQCPASLQVAFDASLLSKNKYRLNLPTKVKSGAEEITVTIPLVFENLTDYVIQYHSEMNTLSSQTLAINGVNFALRQFAVLGQAIDDSTTWQRGIQIESTNHQNTCTYGVNWTVHL